jgi:hypothetical protein
MALGAQTSDVLRLVLKQGMMPVIFGLIAGICAALALGRLLTTMLYEVSPHNPLLLAATAGVLGLAGVARVSLPGAKGDAAESGARRCARTSRRRLRRARPQASRQRSRQIFAAATFLLLTVYRRVVILLIQTIYTRHMNDKKADLSRARSICSCSRHSHSSRYTASEFQTGSPKSRMGRSM